jgi:hypothetical protein
LPSPKSTIGKSYPRRHIIHRPFDFAIVWGCKTCNRISQENWDALALRKFMFSNHLPRFNIPTYSIHIYRGVHTIVPNAITISHNPHGKKAYYTDNKFAANTPHFIFSFHLRKAIFDGQDSSLT